MTIHCLLTVCSNTYSPKQEVTDLNICLCISPSIHFIYPLVLCKVWPGLRLWFPGVQDDPANPCAPYHPLSSLLLSWVVNTVTSMNHLSCTRKLQHAPLQGISVCFNMNFIITLNLFEWMFISTQCYGNTVCMNVLTTTVTKVLHLKGTGSP